MLLIAEDVISIKKSWTFCKIDVIKYGLYGIKTLLVSCPKHYDFFGENNTELQKTVSVFKAEVKLCPLRENVNCSVEHINFVIMFNRKILPMKLVM